MEQPKPEISGSDDASLYGGAGIVAPLQLFSPASMVMISLLQPMVKSSSYVAGDRRSKYARPYTLYTPYTLWIRHD